VADRAIYALKYAGPVSSSGAFLMWMRSWEQTVKRCYYIWCIRDEDKIVVVDTGVGPRLADQRGLPGYTSPAVLLERMGVDAAEVGHVILTHLHWDHANGIELFPAATFYVQEEEFRFWAEDPVAGKGPFRSLVEGVPINRLAELRDAKRLRLLRGDTRILPGIECLLSPGHTVALQTVAVDTAQGTAIIASDCAHSFLNISQEWPSVLICDLVAWTESFSKIKARADSEELVFPGHDIGLAENYPPIEEGITKLV
jgi:glyoxylase-like metal-dependent hydrolase (beta-lactamase superfamily II)